MERKIVDYKIMTCLSLNDQKSFERSVLEEISAGWHPLGGVSVTCRPYDYFYAQTMVKYGDETAS